MRTDSWKLIIVFHFSLHLLQIINLQANRIRAREFYRVNYFDDAAVVGIARGFDEYGFLNSFDFRQIGSKF